VSCLYVHNSHGVGEPRSLLPSGDYDDRIALFDEMLRLTEIDSRGDACVHVLQPVVQSCPCKYSLSGMTKTTSSLTFVVERQDSSVEVRLSRCLCAASDGDDGTPGAILGDQVGGPARRGDDYDGGGHTLGRGLDGGDGHGVGRVDRGDRLREREIVTCDVLSKC
jgi:hypothetical protein